MYGPFLAWITELVNYFQNLNSVRKLPTHTVTLISSTYWYLYTRLWMYQKSWKLQGTIPVFLRFTQFFATAAWKVGIGIYRFENYENDNSVRCTAVSFTAFTLQIARPTHFLSFLCGRVEVIYYWNVNDIRLSLHSISKYSVSLNFRRFFSNSVPT